MPIAIPAKSALSETNAWMPNVYRSYRINPKRAAPENPNKIWAFDLQSSGFLAANKEPIRNHKKAIKPTKGSTYRIFSSAFVALGA